MMVRAAVSEFQKYVAWREQGARPIDVVRPAIADGFGKVARLRLLREVFGLDRARAEEVLAAASGDHAARDAYERAERDDLHAMLASLVAPDERPSISLAQAEAQAAAYVAEQGRDVAGGCVLLRAQTLVLPIGWVFFYQAKRFVEQPDPQYCLLGNSPFLIELSGLMTQLGTASPVERSLRQLAHTRLRQRGASDV
jgi:hypothetical protein